MKEPFGETRHLLTMAIGDCDYCGHSILYHMPLVGCIKCHCDEYD